MQQRYASGPLLITLCLVQIAHSAEFSVRRLSKDSQQQTQFLNAEYLVASVNHAKPKEKLPVLIFLHGAGGRGNDIQKVRGNVRRALGQIEQYVTEPCLIVAPQAKMGTREIPATWIPKDLDQLLVHLKATEHVDESRIYLTGTSMGGYGTWAWAAHSPQHFAAVAPVAGGLGKGGPKDITPELDRWASSLVSVPVWAFHGANDRTVPADRSTRMVKLIQEKGGKQAQTRIYPNEGHGAGRQVYSSREFFEWMFSQKKSATRK